MTTITATDRPPASALGRILNVARLHIVTPWTAIGLPWLILGVILLGNVAIWALILANVPEENRAKVSEGFGYSGSSMFIFVYMMVVAVQAISVTFPFALGYGVTRRDYYLGTGVTFIGLAAMYSVGLTILAGLEEATNGWGLNGSMFSTFYYGEAWYERLFIFFAAFLFFFAVGMAAASIWVRWKANGLVAFFIGLGVLVLGGGALITFTASWVAVGTFFANAGLVGSFAWSLVITVIAAVGGFFVLRRATPKG